MKRVLSAAATAAALFPGSPVLAATSAPLSFDCDVPADHSSSVGVGAGSAVSVATRITPASMRPGKSMPNAGVLVSTQDGRNAIGVQIMLQKADARAFTLLLVGRNEGAPVRQVLGEVPLANPIEITVAFDAAGKGKVQIGTVTTPLAFGDPGPKRVSAFCSAGQFRFAPLNVLSN